MHRSHNTVFVGLSGGVDSSVAAARLLREGYTVVGVFIKVWQPPFLACNWEAERLDAMRVAAHLGIPFLTCDAQERYKTEVVDYLVREYAAGRTPNPDVMCNKHVKFGAFLEFADQHGADLVATGHYARRINTTEGPQLWRGRDPKKDQSYFLWSLTTDQLSRSLFPVGDTHKAALRIEAEAQALPTARKPDSQGVCFLGELNMKDFLQHFIPKEPGDVLDTHGKVVGTHEGARFYTLGQRHGFSVHQDTTEGKPYYICAKDLTTNTLTVQHEKPMLAHSIQKLTLTDLNWMSDVPHHEVAVQIRYRQQPLAAHVEEKDGGVIVHLHEQCDAPAPGQSCVIYDGERCVGGGLIV